MDLNLFWENGIAYMSLISSNSIEFDPNHFFFFFFFRLMAYYIDPTPGDLNHKNLSLD